MDAMLDQLIKKTAEDIWYDAHNTDKQFNAPDFMRAFRLGLSDEDDSFKLQVAFLLKSKVKEEFADHLKHCTYRDNPDQCPENVYYYSVERALLKEIKRLNPQYEQNSVQTELINSTSDGIRKFKNAAGPYQVALDTFQKGGDDRVVLDSLRLSLELMLKELLSNSKPIEKQRDALGSFLKRRGNAAEITAMFDCLTAGFTSYQNEYVKHTNKLRRDEVVLIMNLTMSFMDFLERLE